ncbi:Two component regulator three Y domain-containing protein [Flagellimonas sp. S3867]|uniref:helix-turn-helix and ligand-binding sensor domain-containing protein n=1 Tax=Flagellimonas sp. S3867 TaxID=2768063 RepID=UPI001CC26511|nr:Two component regulator three Y domain-containing protein [Flagellimonas sp. S3867]
MGASKNWGLAVNDEGELFVANNKGLLHFNGEKWVLNKLPNNTIIRSVAVVDDKIFTGSYEEFGFWKKNNLAELQYTSLTHLIKDHEFTSEEFWEILSVEDQVVFRSFSTIYSYSGDKITYIDPPQIISDILVSENRLIVAGGTEGLFEVIGEHLIPLNNQDILFGKTLTDMITFNGGILIGTKLNGCYLWNGQDIVPWNVGLNQNLKQHQLNKILKLAENSLAFGTIKNGVYLYNTLTGESKILNREAGLQNNTVLSMQRFQDQLWLGLDNGLARTNLNNPITYFTDFSGTLGMVYDMAFHQNKLYLGSNTGVFYFDGDQIKFVNGSQGHVWDLEVVEGDLLCGHNTGTYRIGPNTFEKISPFSGGYGFARVPEQNSVYIQGTYNGLVKYKKGDNGNWDSYRISDIKEPVKHLCFETPNILWVAHPYKGYSRLKIDDKYENIIDSKEYFNQNAPSEYNIKLYNIKNQIVFRGENSWYKYDPIVDRIVVFDEFQKFNDHELLFYDQSHFSFVNREGKKEIIHTNLKQDSLTISDFSLNERLAPDSQNIIKINDSISYVTLSDGFAMINRGAIQNWLKGTSLPTPKLNLVKDEKTTYPSDGNSIKIPYKNSQVISFEVSSPELIQPRYFYELIGPKSYAEFTEEGTIEFQNLSHGEYRFKVSTVGQGSKVSQSVSFLFEIAPPWYLSKGSILLYILIGIGIVLMVRFYNRRKFKRKQRELELQMKKEQKEQMAALEKDKLAREIKLKQNELASTTLNIAKKNEMILELKNMLVVNKDKFSNSQRYRSFIKKLNNSIQDTDDWKRFEVNFKELHEDFFERLLKQYPNLTPKDLKLCAYLKMNLSTKEIAPLMAISVRGVEIHRYRLRKKLEIDSTKSLSNFLITF